MSKIVANVNGGASDEYGTFAAINRLLTGDVIEGFQVVPNSTPNMTVKVSPGSGRISTGTYPSSYGYFINHDTVGGEAVTIATAAASPRIDYIVSYIDKAVTAAVSPVNNTNNLLKFAAVAGTPAGSPVVPTVSQIQTAIGAANPYSIYAQVAVAASVTTITTPNITDLRNMITPISKVNRQNNLTNMTESGGRILTGWGVMTVTTASSNFSNVVTFGTSFSTLPIIVITYGGDNVTASGSLYGNGGNNIEGPINIKAHTVTNSSFTAQIHKPSGANYGGNGFAYYQWMAIGI